MHAKENRLLYFGDLDYEGIGIYERLAELFQKEAVIRPFEKAYLYMLEKYRKRGVEFLPDSSKKQNRNISGAFFSFFSEEAAGEMKQILEQGKYIPQESLNLNDIMTKLVTIHSCPRLG